MPKPLSEAAREKLLGVSTATLTTQLFKRGLRNTFVQGARPLNATAPAMVGPAYTLRYIPAREDIDTLDVFADRTHPQRKAVEEADSLVAQVIKRLSEVFADERTTLEHQWDRGDQISTEDLRIALRKYRSFFDRLLSL